MTHSVQRLRPGTIHRGSALPILAGVLLGAIALLNLGAARPAHAAQARGIKVAGTASGAGTLDITIESFAPDIFDPRSVSMGLGTMGTASPMTLVSVPIGSGSTAPATSAAIASALNAAFAPSKITRFVIPRDPAIDLLITDTGTFTMAFAGSVPGQAITETSPICCPAVTPWGLLLVGGLMVILGMTKFRRPGSDSIA